MSIREQVEFEKDYMRTREVADYLGVHIERVNSWRKRRQKLDFYKVGSVVLYKRDDVRKLKKSGQI